MKQFAIMLITLATLLLKGSDAGAQQVPSAQFWMSGIPVSWMNKQSHLPPNDFMEVFASGAAWQQGESKVSVFKFPAQFVLFGSDEQIRTAFDALRQRHIKTAIEMGAVVLVDTSCGGGEGYAPPNLADKIGSRLHGLGLTLDYVAFDEPVWFAHERTWAASTNGAPACGYPLPKVVQLVGITVKTIRRYFPAAEFGDIEPINTDHVNTEKAVADYTQFARLLEQETGSRMAFFHADIATSSRSPWLPQVAGIKQAMRQMRIPFGAVVGGTPAEKTAPAWTQAGLNFLRTLEQSPATSLDQVVIQSWQPFPTKMLPEAEPGTETFLLLKAEQMMSHQPLNGSRPVPFDRPQ